MKIYYLVNKKQPSYDEDIEDHIKVFCITENDLFLAIKKINQYIIDNIYYLDNKTNNSLIYSFNIRTTYNHEDNLVYNLSIINCRSWLIYSEIEFEIIKHIEN